MLKPKLIVTSLVFVLTGSLIFYYNGYKNNGFLDGITYFLIVIGWIIILFGAFGRQLLKPKKVSFKKDKNAWMRQKIFAAICYLGFGALVVTNLVVVSNLTNKRVSIILQTDYTQQTIAVVLRLTERNSRGGSKPYAIIQYQALSKIIEQSLYMA